MSSSSRSRLHGTCYLQAHNSVQYPYRTQYPWTYTASQVRSSILIFAILMLIKASLHFAVQLQ